MTATASTNTGHPLLSILSKSLCLRLCMPRHDPGPQCGACCVQNLALLKVASCAMQFRQLGEAIASIY